MFNIGPWELMLILVVALIVVGPNKLPEVAKSIGKGINEFKKVTNGYKREFQEAMDSVDTPPKAANSEVSVVKKEDTISSMANNFESVVSNIKEEEIVKADSTSEPAKE
jgi:sec-independent protein translocase protein TatA